MAQRAGKRKSPDASAGIKRRLNALGCDPLAIIAGIAKDEAADPRLRFYAAKELAAYILPKHRPAKMPQTAPADVGRIIAGAWSGGAAGDEGGTR